MPSKKPKPAAKNSPAKNLDPENPSPPESEVSDVYKNNKDRIDKVLGLCCEHLNGLPFLVVDEVLARLPAYCEAHRVTMTTRSKAKAASRKSPSPKSSKPSPDSFW